ncbi:MAG: hypothetical protein HRT69_18300 [Flavobacteriaceae bacterium]|nr:hypothetical protein [Flavobacteriaceae bacterium]
MPYFSIGVDNMPPGENPWEESREMRLKLVSLDCMKLDKGLSYFSGISQVTLQRGELAYYSFKSKAGIFTKCAYTSSYAKFDVEIDIHDKFHKKFVKTVKSTFEIKKIHGKSGWWETIGQGSDGYELHAWGTGHFKFKKIEGGILGISGAIKFETPSLSQVVHLRPYKR